MFRKQGWGLGLQGPQALGQELPKACRYKPKVYIGTHVLRFLGPQTTSYKAFGLF